jgi:hypothetical protein
VRYKGLVFYRNVDNRIPNRTINTFCLKITQQSGVVLELFKNIDGGVISGPGRRQATIFFFTWSWIASELKSLETLLSIFILPINKEASPASIFGRVWCDLSFRIYLAGLSALLRKS